ncbi:F-box protein At5g07610-like [Papaver somniferum]|uniref:F-box protein At5g07610-like n=1 Tax=Papaver somniferum TaxID=3469 RepID=UPI000E702992|nr:F-box protein At5g07610-like [Papaver somniferum]
MSSSTKQRIVGGRIDILTLVVTRLLSSKVNMSYISLPKLIRKNETNSSASIIGSNVDILILILTRLPSKSLLVFKCVSKQWLSIIVDPKFVHKHFIQNPKFSIPGIFWGDNMFYGKPTYDYISLDENNTHVPFKTLTFAEDEFGIKIEQSCNGLFLCRSNAPRKNDFTYYIFNPLTNKYKILPKPLTSSSSQKFIHSVSLAFDPFKSPYDKVIAFWSNFDNTTKCDEYRIEIYDSEASSWRLSGFYSCTAQAECIPWNSSGIFWEGSLYWCNLQGSMVYFDIDRELVGVLPNPARGYTGSVYHLAEYGGHFYLIGEYYDLYYRISIFEMDVANSSCTPKFYIDMRLNPYGKPTPFLRSLLWHDYMFYIERGEETESAKVFLLTKEAMVVSCDLKDMSFKKIYDISKRLRKPSTAKCYQNIESLACV